MFFIRDTVCRDNLFDHQKAMLCELQAGKRYVCAGCRTGKTRPVIAFLAEHKNVLVLTKKAAVSGWLSELKAMGVEGWTVTNGEKLRTKGWDFSKEGGALVLDEAHGFFSAFPKPSQVTKPCHGLKVGGPRVGVSATPCSESYAQLFHQAKALRLPLWENYKNFYHWHRVYGVPKTIRAHGRMVAVYDDVKERAWAEFKEFCCIVDRQKVVPDFVESEDHVGVIEAPEVLELCEKLKRDQVLEIDGRFIVADTVLGLAQKCQQICAGVVLDDQGLPLVVNTVKRDWVEKRFRGAKVAVLTQFKAEVEQFNGRGLPVGSVAQFQEGSVDWVVGNVASLNAGVDLSRAEAMVMTSVPWSVTQFIQARERLLRKDRTSVAPVYFPVIRDGIDEMIYQKVATEKVDFSSRVYR